VIKSGRPIGGVYNKSIDSLKLDIVKGLLWVKSIILW
jgi:hypothetical protein